VLAYLAGRWQVQRRVVDLESGVEGEFAGVAEFMPDGAGLRWSERGRLRFGAYDGAAVREYRIVPARDGWAVELPDGRPFHPLRWGTVEHLCGEDRYSGEYAVRGPDAFAVLWHVAGPRKRQLIDTTYQRMLQ
jgi:hypothetical protein